MDIIAQILYSLCVCVAFAIIFNAPRKELIFCGLCGCIGWTIFVISDNLGGSIVTSTFFASLSLTTAARLFSSIRKAPSTLYLIPGIIPLVPGEGMYSTIKSMLGGNLISTFEIGVSTLKIAGVIAMGILLVFSLPYNIFNIQLSSKKD